MDDKGHLPMEYVFLCMMSSDEGYFMMELSSDVVFRLTYGIGIF